jgi:hypothetical protein
MEKEKTSSSRFNDFSLDAEGFSRRETACRVTTSNISRRVSLMKPQRKKGKKIL